jgi:predicted nucleic acid-binding protein
VSEPWVINASPVILLAKAGLIERVPALGDPLVIPEPVADEILRVQGEDAAVRWLKGAGKEFVRAPVAELAELSDFGIGAGERAVISWAKAHHGFLAVMDDREARVAAQQLGVHVIGTVAVVLRLKRAGLISEVKSPLLGIKVSGGYIGDELFREALRSAGEKP